MKRQHSHFVLSNGNAVFFSDVKTSNTPNKCFGVESPNCKYGQQPIFPTVSRRRHSDPARERDNPFLPGYYDTWVVSADCEYDSVVFPDQESAVDFLNKNHCPGAIIEKRALGAWELNRVSCLGAEPEKFSPIS